jgi:hypothetical protein
MQYILIALASLLRLGKNLIHCKQTNEDKKLNRGVLRRNLQSGIPYKVNLLLALDYLNETTALQFETSESVPSTSASIHFCYAVNTQVRYRVHFN